MKFYLYLLFFLYCICKVPTVKHLSCGIWYLSDSPIFCQPSEIIFDFHRKRDKESVIITEKSLWRGKKIHQQNPSQKKRNAKSFFMHESQSWHTHFRHLMVQLPVLTLEPYRNGLSHIAYLFLWRINILRMALWNFHGEFDGMLYHTAAYKRTHKH